MQISDLSTWIDGQKSELLEALCTLVEINTYTTNTTGVDRAMDVLSLMAEGMGLRVQAIHGRHRLICTHGGGESPRILLISHMDTVHPPEGDFQNFEARADGFVRGPGTGDMKGGLLMGLWALQAMQMLVPDCDVQLIVSADEEKGSVTIQDWYLDGAGGADYAIGLEPGFTQGGSMDSEAPTSVVFQRKGCGLAHFKIRGKAAHAGGAWEQGISAVEGMAQRVLKIHALTDLDRGMTTNVGWINGGTAANTIAEYCEGRVDFRFERQTDGEELLKAIQELAETPMIHNPHLDRWDEGQDFDLEIMMPAMEATAESQAMIDIVLEEAKRLNQNILPIARGGGSDANYISGAGIPTICGLGTLAEHIHTTQERIFLPGLFERLELLVSTVYRLANDGRG